MSDSVSLILTAIAAGLTALVASDPAFLSDTAQAVIAAVLAALAAVTIKRPGRQATPLKEKHAR